MTTIKLRRGLSTAFSTNNPVLAAGEPAFATDTGILKIGDGTTAYNSLPSIGASPDLSNYVQKTDYASTSAAGVVKVDGSTVVINANGVISSAGSTPSNMVTTDTTQTISGSKTFTSTSGNFFQRTDGSIGSRFSNSGKSGCWVEPDYSGNSYSQTGIAIYTGLYNSSRPTISFAGKGDYERTFIATNPNSNQSVMLIKSPYINIGNTVDFTNNTSYSGLHIDGYGTTGMRYNGNYVPTSPDINNIVKLTQAAYDNLATKDANTFYVIIPSST